MNYLPIWELRSDIAYEKIRPPAPTAKPPEGARFQIPGLNSCRLLDTFNGTLGTDQTEEPSGGHLFCNIFQIGKG